MPISLSLACAGIASVNGVVAFSGLSRSEWDTEARSLVTTDYGTLVGCQEDCAIQGDWCEETCVKDSSQSKALVFGMQKGTCKNNGFDKGPKRFQVDLYSNEAVAGIGKDNPMTIQSDCNPHWAYKQHTKLCHFFCVGDDTDMMKYVETRSGVHKGTCFEHGYDVFVANVFVQTYTKS